MHAWSQTQNEPARFQNITIHPLHGIFMNLLEVIFFFLVNIYWHRQCSWWNSKWKCNPKIEVCTDDTHGESQRVDEKKVREGGEGEVGRNSS